MLLENNFVLILADYNKNRSALNNIFEGYLLRDIKGISDNLESVELFTNRKSIVVLFDKKELKMLNRTSRVTYDNIHDLFSNNLSKITRVLNSDSIYIKNTLIDIHEYISGIVGNIKTDFSRFSENEKYILDTIPFMEDMFINDAIEKMLKIYPVSDWKIKNATQFVYMWKISMLTTIEGMISDVDFNKLKSFSTKEYLFLIEMVKDIIVDEYSIEGEHVIKRDYNGEYKLHIPNTPNTKVILFDDVDIESINDNTKIQNYFFDVELYGTEYLIELQKYIKELLNVDK